MNLRDLYNNNKKGIAGALGLYGLFGGNPVLRTIAPRISSYMNQNNPSAPGAVTPAPNQAQGAGIDSGVPTYIPEPIPGGSDVMNTPTPTPSLRQFDPNRNYYETARDAGDMSTSDLIRLRGHLIDQRGNIAVGAANGAKTDPRKLGFDPFDVAKRAGINLSPDNQDEINRSVANIYSPMVSDVTGLIEANLAKEKAGSGSGSWNSGIFSGMTNQQADDVMRRIDTEYTNLDVVKDFRKLTQQAATILNVDPNNMSSPEAQGLISDYAKSLDPNSVVRTEEYMITKKYSQSLINRIKGEMTQAMYGTGTLSPEAVKIIQDSTRNRYAAQKSQIDYLKDSITKKLNVIYPGKDFSQLITDYSSRGESNKQQGPIEYFGGNAFRYDSATDRYYPVQGFNQVGGGTNTAIKSIDDVLARIARNEGNGKYDQLGPVVTKGAYKGQRAIGRYQVMPGNVPARTKEALGYAMTPAQFMASPQAQEAVARDQMMKSYKKYGNWNDVASVWFTGRPLAQGYKAKDVLGTTGAQYVSKFNS